MRCQSQARSSGVEHPAQLDSVMLADHGRRGVTISVGE